MNYSQSVFSNCRSFTLTLFPLLHISIRFDKIPHPSPLLLHTTSLTPTPSSLTPPLSVSPLLPHPSPVLSFTNFVLPHRGSLLPHPSSSCTPHPLTQILPILPLSHASHPSPFQNIISVYIVILR